jgi:hypothetical protein
MGLVTFLFGGYFYQIWDVYLYSIWYPVLFQYSLYWVYIWSRDLNHDLRSETCRITLKFHKMSMKAMKQCYCKPNSLLTSSRRSTLRMRRVEKMQPRPSSRTLNRGANLTRTSTTRTEYVDHCLLRTHDIRTLATISQRWPNSSPCRSPATNVCFVTLCLALHYHDYPTF